LNWSIPAGVSKPAKPAGSSKAKAVPAAARSVAAVSSSAET
jgi:hypothetical protein